MRDRNIDLNGKTILITGCAGFIGSVLTQTVIKNYEAKIIGMDNLNSYYDRNLKTSRLEMIDNIKDAKGCFSFIKADISDKKELMAVFENYRPQVVVNLAAQAGVRYSIENPDAYINSNIIGFYNILEACRTYPVLHLVYASSSSVYGGNKKVPFSTDDKTENPVSLYAATKKTNELLAYSYSKLYRIPTTGLRFFTVYGPAGRPDMAYFSFAEKLSKGENIQIFNYGHCKRDFTYIDDIVKGVILVMQCSPLSFHNIPNTEKKARDEVGEVIGDLHNSVELRTVLSEKPCLEMKSDVFEKIENEEKKRFVNGLTGEKNTDNNVSVPYYLYNIGGGMPEDLMEFVLILSGELIRAGVLDKNFDIKKHIEFLPMQKGDVEITFADSSALERDFGFKPTISLKEGLRAFAEWYASYMNQHTGKV